MEPLRLTLGNDDFEATPENTSLFTYVGVCAVHDHVFLELTHNEKQAFGRHIFRVLETEIYDHITKHIKRNHYPQHLNLLQVAQCDVDAFNMQAFKDLIVTDEVPEGWTDGTE